MKNILLPEERESELEVDQWEALKVSYWFCVLLIPLPIIANLVLGKPLLPVLVITVVLAVIGFCAHHFGQSLTPHIIGMVLVGHVITLTAGFSGHPWQLDIHMLFFVLLAVVATQNNIGSLITTAVFIAGHHLALSFVLPALVYPSSELVQNLSRTALHGAIVVLEVAVLAVSIHAKATLNQRIYAKQVELKDSFKVAQAAQAEAIMTKEAVVDVVNVLRGGLQRLAEQDLDCEICVDVDDDYVGLVNDFNSAVKTFGLVLSDAAATSHDFQSSAVELAGAAQDLAQRTEKQAQSLMGASVTVDGLSKSLDETVSHAQTATEQSKHASENAQQGGMIVKNAVLAMDEIEKSSQEISAIITVIEDIAFQTNMLALNAAVEAARAGESGRGFSVVASEVRTLAQNTATAANDVKDLIRTSANHVSRGAALVTETGQSLDQILVSASQANELIQTIYGATATQAKSLNQVNAVVASLNETTHANSTVVEQMNAMSKSMSDGSAQLAENMTTFQFHKPSAA